MTYTSLVFAIFAGITIIIYYLFPLKQYKWVVLLAASCFFYVYSSYRYAAFIVITTLTIFLAGRAIEDIGVDASKTVKANRDVWSREERKAFKGKTELRKKRILAGALVFNLGILFVLKYLNFMAGGLMHLLAGLGGMANMSGAAGAALLPGGVADTIAGAGDAQIISIALPLGISFYTFQATGYLIDVYRGTVRAERNFFKFALFVSFFPQIIQGPISSFGQLHERLIEPHEAKWINFKQGFMIVCWGVFKKIVIADAAWSAIKAYHAGGGINGNGDFAGYGGTMTLFISLTYALQLYTDFSGGIDISRGICRILGIDLTANFRQPYFSRSISEYWRRWHITLGAWMKNYVFYPVAMSGLARRLSKAIAESGFGKTPAGRHVAKVFTTAMASFVVFLLVGIWHGANSKYIAFGVWNGLIIMLSALLGPAYDRAKHILHIREEAAWWKLFQMLRTFLIVLVGYIFDIADNFSNAMHMMKRILCDQNLGAFIGELHTLGMQPLIYLSIAFNSLFLLYISIRLEMTSLDTPAELLERRRGLIQWIALFGLIMLILVFGTYGPAYDPAEFVYQQF